jgi:hypothetical protein
MALLPRATSDQIESHKDSIPTKLLFFKAGADRLKPIMLSLIVSPQVTIRNGPGTPALAFESSVGGFFWTPFHSD